MLPPMKFKFEKEIVRGKRFYRLVSFEVSTELPKEYVNEPGFCIRQGPYDYSLSVKDGTGKEKTVIIGYLFSPIDFKKFVEVAKKAGERLGKINQALAWSGYEEVII